MDASDAAVPSATVTATNTGTGISRTVTTNEAGAYTVPSLIPGGYEVKVINAGFKTQIQSNVVLQTGAVVKVDFKLGCTPAECDFSGRPNFWTCSYGLVSRKIGYGHFCSSRCPTPGTPTRIPGSRCQAHAPRLPVRTYDQVQQTGLRLCAGSQGSSRSLSQPHACRCRQDAIPLPHRRAGRSGPAANRCWPPVSRPRGCPLGGMRTMGRQSNSGCLSLLRRG